MAAVVAGVLLRWAQNQNQNKDGAEIIGLLDNPLPSDVNEAANLSSEGKYDESNKLIDESLLSADDATKYELYLQKGLNFENDAKYQEALAAYQEAVKIKQDFTIYSAIARVAEQLGDKQVAIENYKKALPLIPEDPMAEFERRKLEEKIKELGG